MFSKKVFEQAGRYNPNIRLIQDFDLWSRMLPLGRIVKLSKVLYQYRMDPHSSQRKDMAKTFNQINIVLSNYIQRYRFPHKRKPRFIVFGSKAACKNYVKHIQPKTKFMVKEYVTHVGKKSFDRAIKAVETHIIEGIIVLDGPGCRNTMEYLQSKGLILNQHIFHCLNLRHN